MKMGVPISLKIVNNFLHQVLNAKNQQYIIEKNSTEHKIKQLLNEQENLNNQFHNKDIIPK